LDNCCANFSFTFLQIDQGSRDVPAVEAELEHVVPPALPYDFYDTSIDVTKAQNAIKPEACSRPAARLGTLRRSPHREHDGHGAQVMTGAAPRARRVRFLRSPETELPPDYLTGDEVPYYPHAGVMLGITGGLRLDCARTRRGGARRGVTFAH
jgi:hypothetical protein